MSHQTGITGSPELQSFFATAKDGTVRLIKVSIKDETMITDHHAAPIGTWEDDWDRLVRRCLEKSQPCYIFYRLDAVQDSSGYEWIYIAYSPDSSPVKQKMLYAATRSTLKKEFGNSQIRDEMFGTVPDDVMLDGYRKHLISQDAPPPMSMAEEELAEIKKKEVSTDISVDSKHQTLQGVAFPMAQEAMDSLVALQQGEHTYTQLSVNIEEERIELAESSDADPHTLSSKIPLDHARYHFLLYRRTHEGDHQESIVFIYSMPGYKCSIKERMLYSSCKAPLIDMVEQRLGCEIEKKIEIDDPKELTPEFLYEEVHPKKTIVRPQFAKPKGPAGRGPKRMTKPKDGEQQ